MQYRSEIDGLRTVAVVPVVLFHAGFALFSGGFIGVDIFFVISGYLITSIIIRDLDRGSWSLLDFYERRARRILPALALVILCCWPAAWIIMLPLEMKDFAQSAAAAALSVSNLLFWHESDYFGAAAELKPLLHTWSLGVEEQFYIFFPPLLALIWLWPMKRKIVVLGSVALVSFLLCVALVHSMPAAVFYLLPFRAWELLAGGGCAFWHSRNSREGNGPLAFLGLAALVTSILVFDKTTPFPSVYTLLPVAGTCLLLLFAAPDNLAGRLLSFRPMVGIGLISYSAYLWHQPLLAFGRLYSPDPPSQLVLLGLSVLSFALAYLSWRFVETPFRRRGAGALLPGRRLVLSLSVGIIGLGVVGGAWGHLRDGWPTRYSSEQQAFLDAHRWSSQCMFTRVDPLGSLPVAACSFAAQGPERGKVALVGDSVMSSLSPELIGFFTSRGYAVEQFTHSYCTLHRSHRYDSVDAAGCPEFISRTVDYIAAEEFDLVLTAGSFLNFVSEGAHQVVRDDGSAVSVDSLRRDMADTIAATGAQLILIHPHPQAQVNVLNRAVRELRTHNHLSPYSTQQAGFQAEFEVFRDILIPAFPPDTVHVDLTAMFCDGTRCDFIHEGAPVLSDQVHFTKYGAHVLVRPALEQALEQAGL